ncbi:hypothetical protein PPM_p0189 (plasmid) [Paenibacillus polymyxa M1]|uniref:hypothetical protein n=1 Tax=Paenibacillus polymyxa TaxID=1406 RepID=UPI00021BBBA9|nr:hypothetical protein [Paenibacillus polymyxa]CCC86339.1 hypothetical protein PPM_p0189 [Paenibacillus polymyxa M1]
MSKQNEQSKKLELLNKVIDQYTNAKKVQYSPEGLESCDFLTLFYTILGIEETDMGKIEQNIVNVVFSPKNHIESKISILLNEAGFTPMELARLESFSYLNDQISIMRDLQRMKKKVSVLVA